MEKLILSERVTLQRKPAANAAHRAQASRPLPAPVLERARGSAGHALDANTLERMETRLGHHFAQMAITPVARAAGDAPVIAPDDRTERQADRVEQSAEIQTTGGIPLRMDFRGVRIHTDAPAQDAARALNALAFTMGRDIFFDAGQFAPGTRAGEGLLAHELAHVSQQARAPQTNYVIQRKEGNKSLPAADALKAALNGDDDATRDLTNNPEWEKVELTPDQSATLIIHLLDGFTGDDDENAGLEILRKNLAQLVMDDTLQELDKRNRFDQLLDDYDGSEYRVLLDLLSNHIERTTVKARYLDAFIAMWWVREHEERAIVVLLERTDLDKQVELLTAKHRFRELRKAIDTEELEVRYEKILKGVNIKHGELLATKLQAIFTVEASKSVAAGTRTQAEVDTLLKAAAADVASELLEYATELEKTLKNPRVSAFAIERLNKKFEERLDELIKHKSAEFGIELKYNVEFNRGLKAGFGRLWTLDDLKEIDEILAKLPPELVHFNPKFHEFQRERSNSDYAGQAYWNEETIVLAGALSRRTAAHELGHMIDYSDKDLGKDFRALSKWETLSVTDMTRLIPDAKRREKIIKALEKDRDNDDTYDREKEGDYYYHYDRYHAAQYLRYHKDACFISGYAQTDPYDDFADTVEEYIVDPKNLQKGCGDKYEFMHVRVFVEYWLKQQAKGVEKEFDEAVKKVAWSISHGMDLWTHVKDDFVTPIRDELVKELTGVQTAKVAQAKAGKLPDPLPLKGSKEIKTVAAPYLERLRALLALSEKVLKPYARYNDDVFSIYLFLDDALDDGFDALSTRLADEFRGELTALLDPLAERIVKGDKVEKPAWPEVDAIEKQMQAAVLIMDGYAKYYGELKAARTKFSLFVMSELGHFVAKSKSWESLRLFAVERVKLFLAEMDTVVKNVRAGTAFDAKTAQDPQKRLAQYESEVQAFAKKLPK